TATVRPMTGSTALYTMPIAPRPSSPTISYLPAFATVSICNRAVFRGHESACLRQAGRHPGALLGTVPSEISIGPRSWGTSVSDSILGWLDCQDTDSAGLLPAI